MIKKIFFGILFLVLLSSFFLKDQEDVFKGYPVPKDKNVVFYIQKNYNTNTVVYTANISKNGKLNSKNPIIYFWRRYQEDGRKKELSFFESKFGFGVNVKPIKDRPNAYSFTLAGVKNMNMVITQSPNGNAEVASIIGGVPSILERVFIVVAAHKNLIFPKIASIEVFGKSINDGKATYQKIVN